MKYLRSVLPIVCVIFCSVILSGCGARNIPTDRYQAASDHFSKLMKKEMLKINDPNNALEPLESFKEASEFQHLEYDNSEIDNVTRVDISASTATPTNFFALLGKEFKTNFLVMPDVNTPITMHLRNATMKNVAQMCYNSLGIVIRKSGDGYSVHPEPIHSKTYQLPIIGTNKTISNSTITSPRDENGTSAQGSSEIRSQYVNNAWQEIETVVTEIVKKHSPDGISLPGQQGTTNAQIGNARQSSVISLKHMGMLIVTAPQRAFKEINKFIQTAAEFLYTQVSIEARIYDVSYNRNLQAGFDWSKLSLHLGQLMDGNSNFSPSGNEYEIDSGGTIILGRTLKHPQGVFNAVFSFLKSVGNARIVASPKVCIVNGECAILKVGTTKRVIGGITSRYQKDQNGNFGTPSSDITFASTFSGIALFVHVLCTPGTRRMRDMITLHLKPFYSSDSERTIDINLDGRASRIPIVNMVSKDTDTVVRVPNGGFLLFAGLEKSEDINEFKSGTRRSGLESTQIVIVLHVKQIDPSRTSLTLKQASNYFKSQQTGLKKKSNHKTQKSRVVRK